ncbi:MAG: hypothetical protein DRO89_04950 [Candidatus Altiarchaeales archaeon]|nr:MAG: hypothetical protein DRO89_04950 [Candidatus Altiarchaeales archaeon]
MVLESLVTPSQMEKTPRDMFYVGFIYSTLGLLLAYWIFGSYSSLAGVFITAMPLVVIMYRVLKLEERKDIEFSIYERYGRPLRRSFLIKEHGRAVSLFIFLFLGMVISYSLWSTVLPEDVINRLFGSQIETIEAITVEAMGNTIDPDNVLISILYNNFKVLMFCIVFSFLYGSGAIFILTWNASVIGVAIGSIIRNSLINYGKLDKISFLYNYFGSFSISLSYAVHGIPEIAAYFIGALGGGIISVAVVNHDLRSREFRNVIIDSLDLILLSCVILFLAGLIEVYVTPLLF